MAEPGTAGYGGVLPGNPGQGYFPAHNLPVPTPSQLGAKPAPSKSPFDSDPGYQSALAQEQLGIGSQNQALNNLIQQRIISYGDPALAQMAGFGLDPQAGAFARQNYLSGNAELARIDKSHKNNLQAIINQLAGRGLVFSGETGYQTGQEDQGYGNNVYDSQQKALSDILGYRSSTAQNEQGLHQGVIDALQTAYQNYLNHPELGNYGQPTTAKATAPKATAPKVVSPKSSKAKTVARALVNPYTTGQKRFG